MTRRMPDDTTSVLVRRALAVAQAYLALGNERVFGPLGTFVRNRKAPLLWDANHVADPRVSTPEEVERLLAEVERVYTGFAHRRIDLGPDSAPSLETALATAGWIRRPLGLMILEGRIRGLAPAVDLRAVVDDDGWRAIGRLRALAWDEQARRVGLSRDPAVAEQAALVARAKSPDVRWWLARRDGEPCGYFGSWPGIDGVGKLEDLFVHPAHRGRGIATALVHRSVADARTRGAAAVVLLVDPDDTPRRMYAAMGFRPLGVKRDWLRRP